MIRQHEYRYRTRLVCAIAGLAICHGLFALQNAKSEDDPVKQTAENVAPAVAAIAEIAELRPIQEETTARLKSLTEAPAKDKSAGTRSKPLRDALNERLAWIDELRKAMKELQNAENPKVNPAREAAALKAEIERSQAGLEQSAKKPDALLPEAFRNLAGKPIDVALKAMKEAIDDVEDELKDKRDVDDSEKIESKDRPLKTADPLSTLRVEREKLVQGRPGLASRRKDRETALASAQGPEGRNLAKELMINIEWETRVQAERLRAVDASIDLQTKRVALADLRRTARKSSTDLARKTLEIMQKRFRDLADRQSRDLARAAAAETERARVSNDPLERYRARRKSELLDLRSELLKDVQALDAEPVISLREQTEAADRAAEDFDSLKRLVREGRSSPLVATRLNYAFRRLSSERDAIVHRELALANREDVKRDNDLNEIEMDILNDDRDDRVQLDELLEAIPPPRHAELFKAASKLEEEHRALLENRRAVLVKLAANAEATLKQVQRRVNILDEEYAFLRTNIFWVRDQEPIGPEMIDEARLEVPRLVRAVGRVSREVGTPNAWQRRPSLDFLLALGALVVLPWPIVRVRGLLRGRLVGEPRLARESTAETLGE